MFKVPPLGYGYDALEPYIDTLTMTIHHDKHHGAYVAALNGLIEKYPGLATTSPVVLLSDLTVVPDAVRAPVRNNLGGHWNHSFFWELMTPGGAKEPSGDLKAAIDSTFGSQAQLIEKVNAAGSRPLRLWLGVADRRQGRQARDHLDAQSGHAARTRRSTGGAGRRCVGARLLSQISEQARRLSRGMVEYGELGQSGGEFRQGAGVSQASVTGDGSLLRRSRKPAQHRGAGQCGHAENREEAPERQAWRQRWSAAGNKAASPIIARPAQAIFTQSAANAR